MNLDIYTCAGYALELLSKSEYHKQHPTRDYFRSEILYPLQLGQIKFYVTNEGVPTGMVTWAWLSDEVRDDIHKSGRVLSKQEWKSGNNLFFNDFVTPYGHLKEVIRDLKNLFPNEIATSLRRHQDSSVRKVNRWVGVDYYKSDSKQKFA